MAKEPRSNIKMETPRIRYKNGLVIGNTEFGSEELTNIETVANLSAEDLEALASSAEALDVIGIYEGENNIATDLAAVIGTVGNAEAGLVADVDALETSVNTAETGLLDRATALETAVDSMLTVRMLNYTEDTTVGYYYSDKPTADVDVDIPTGKTAASIAPGGATAWALNFDLPATNTTDTYVFRVYYSLGTHTGTLTIGGKVVTGTGVLHFFWNGTAWATWNAGAYSITLPDNSVGVIVGLVDAGNTNALTVVLPNSVTNISRTSTVLVNLTADSDTACTLNLTGQFMTGAGLSSNVTNVANGAYVLYCIDTQTFVPLACTAVATN